MYIKFSYEVGYARFRLSRLPKNLELHPEQNNWMIDNDIKYKFYFEFDGVSKLSILF